MVSLGCPKNLVDSEMILGNVGEAGLSITPSPEDADVIIINTCGFIESAKEESINTILEMCELKSASATPKKVVVTGCLGQRYGVELKKEVPEVDAIIGLGEYENIGAALKKLSSELDGGHGKKKKHGESLYQVSDPTKACNAEVGRFRLTPRHYAYVKISEGCDNPCTFCAIPSIRGAFRSKPISMVLEEVGELVSSGTKEIIIISQDTTSYGVDLTGKFELSRLLEAIASVRGVEWIRILYAYPAFFTDEMIDSIASIDKVVKYVDIPLQHISDKMLRRMGRRSNESKTRALLSKLRERIPGLYLRTTFIVGFPGEDEGEFGTLRDFVREFGFERLGVFPYSEEEGTPAASFQDQVLPEVRAKRFEELMLVQQENAFRQSRARKGQLVSVLIDGNVKDRARARSYGEAPEIDPCIYVSPRRRPSGPKGAANGTEIALDGEGKRGADPRSFREIPVWKEEDPQPVNAGDFVTVKIMGNKDYDLLAEMVG